MSFERSLKAKSYWAFASRVITYDVDGWWLICGSNTRALNVAPESASELRRRRSISFHISWGVAAWG